MKSTPTNTVTGLIFVYIPTSSSLSCSVQCVSFLEKEVASRQVVVLKHLEFGRSFCSTIILEYLCKQQTPMLCSIMMDTTIQLHLLRQKKIMMRPFLFMASLFLLINISSQSDAYTIPSFARIRITKTTQKMVQRSVPVLTFERQDRIMRRIVLCAVEKATGSTDDSPKKKRRRKLSTASTDAPSQSGEMASNVELNETEEQGSMLPNQSPRASIDLAMMNEIARFEFQNTQNDAGIDLLEPSQQSTTSAVSGAILLPDIKEARKRKQMEEEVARLQQQQDDQKIKIKRTDKEAFRRVSLF